jgi:hypothetical protein
MQKRSTNLFVILYIIGIVFASLGMSRFPLGDPLFYPLFTVGLVFLAAGLILQMRLASGNIEEQ